MLWKQTARGHSNKTLQKETNYKRQPSQHLMASNLEFGMLEETCEIIWVWSPSSLSPLKAWWWGTRKCDFWNSLMSIQCYIFSLPVLSTIVSFLLLRDLIFRSQILLTFSFVKSQARGRRDGLAHKSIWTCKGRKCASQHLHREAHNHFVAALQDPAPSSGLCRHLHSCAHTHIIKSQINLEKYSHRNRSKIHNSYSILQRYISSNNGFSSITEFPEILSLSHM